MRRRPKLSLPDAIERIIDTLERRHVREMLGTTLNGVLFAAVFAVGYARVPQSYYQARDDAVITASHVRNLVEYGTIGVNPSGERVEAFSAPLQFLLYLPAYALGGVSFKAFFTFQTYFAAFVIGVFFHRFLLLFGCSRVSTQLGIGAGAAIFLVCSFSFFEWHGSGMENPLTHMMFFIAIYLLYKMMCDVKVNLWYAPVVFFASISRIEAIFHMGPLVLLFGLLWAHRHRTATGLKLFVCFIALWGAFNALRYAYFGDIFPNTAAANNVFVSSRVAGILRLDAVLLKGAVLMALQAVSKLHGLVLIALFSCFLIRSLSRRAVDLLMLICVLLITSFTFFLVFGMPRLDLPRPISFIPLFIALLSAVVFIEMSRPAYRAGFVLVLVLSVLLANSLNAIGPYPLCCEASHFDRARQIFKRLGKAHNLHRPTVACPDLGFISWQKEFNIVDLGWLGSPVLATFKEGRQKALVSDYLFEFTQPDIIHIHGGWRRVHLRLLKDPRFKSRYESAHYKDNRGKPRKMPNTWIRKDIERQSTSRERALIDQLKKRVYAAPIASALDECGREPAIHACLYATRTVYRFLPELHKAGLLDHVRLLFNTTKTSAYDLAVLSARDDGMWYKKVVSALTQYHAMAKPLTKAMLASTPILPKGRR